MIAYDIHTHLLPGMDDGAGDLNESLEMLKSARDQGVKLCAATPHCIVHGSDHINSFIETRQKCFEELKKGLIENPLPVPDIILGAEVYMDHDISKHSEIKKLCYENTDCMLIELTNGIDVQSYAEWIYSLTLLGINPLIAHVHRYANALDLITELGGLGIRYQINCEAFLSIRGLRQLRKLLSTDDTFIVSSDMHNTTSRVCNIESAYKKSLKIYPKKTEELFALNAKRVLDIP